MFDNSIFASFIPQLIMLFGYLMCVIAPSLSHIGHAEAQTVGAKYIESHQIVLQSDSNQNVSIDKCYFFNDFDNYAEVILTLKLEFPQPVILANNFPEKHFFINKLPLFGIFSRPPPQYC